MADYKLILGNKRYSSWSLRGWLLAKQAGISFEEVVVPLRQPDTRARILEFSPAGKVPTLLVDGEAVWDSLAIAEYLAETFPEKALWPADPKARRLARSLAAEMHSGFPALRNALPMDLSKHFPGHVVAPEVRADIDRIQAIWRDCRERYGAGGDFLFDAFSAADAFYAPVVTRFRTYDVRLDGPSEAYCQAIMESAWMKQWAADAAEETWVIEFG